MKVLVIEDDGFTMEVLQLRLERLGCEVLMAIDVAKGLALAIAERPDFALIDLQLQGDTDAGLEAARALRGNPLTADIPLIIHSIFVRHPGELGEDAGLVDGYLPKPFKVAELASLIDAHRRPARPTTL